jgi:hypothetical protein
VLTPTAEAEIITFESIAPTNLENSSIAIDDFTLTHSGSFAQILVNQGSDFSGNGTKRLISFNSSTITLTRTDGGVFNFIGFDGAESWALFPHTWATGIRVTGFDQSLNIVAMQVFTLDLIKDPLLGFQTFTASGFNQLTRLEFSGVCGSTGCNPEFSLDNLGLEPIPEPASMVLLAFGLCCSRRRLAARGPAKRTHC